MLHGTINNYTLKFNKLMFDGSGCANIIVCKGTDTKGILYKIPFVSLLNLNIYEGYPNHYTNIILPVETSIGTINAYVYIANQTYVVDGLLPNKKYFDSIISYTSQ